jgi:hypothetical protein
MGRACSMYREMRNAYNILVLNLKKRDHLQGLGVDEMMTIKYTLKK